MSMRVFQAGVRVQALLASGAEARARVGHVSEYDKNNGCIKVKIQPEDVETGWMPVMTMWQGNGWGHFSPPPRGALVLVLFLNGEIEAPVCLGRMPNDTERPLPTEEGDHWIVHENGASIKITADGPSITMFSPNGLKIEGDTEIIGNLTVSEDITDQTVNGNAATVKALRTAYDAHKHGASPTTDHPV